MQITCPGCGSAYALNAPLPPQGMPCPRCGAGLMPHLVAKAPHPPTQPAPHPSYSSQYPAQAAPQAYGGQGYPAPGYGSPMHVQPQSAAPWNAPAMPGPGYPAPPPGLNASLPPAYAGSRGSWPAWAIPAIVGGGIAALVLIGVGIARSLGRPSEPAALVASVPAAPGTTPPSAPAPPPATSTPVPAAAKPSFLEGLKAATGFADSHDKILTEFVSKAKELPPLFNSIQDTSSRDKAVSRLGAMNKEITDLSLRAARLEPLSSAEHKALLERHKTDLQVDKNGNEQNMRRLQSAGLLTPELSGVMFEFVMTLGTFMKTINEGIIALPEPQNDNERFLHSVVQLQRELNRTLAQTKTAAEYGQLNDKLTTLLAKVETLNQQPSNTVGGAMFGQAESKYLRYRIQAESQTTMIFALLQKLYETSPALGQQLAQFSSRCTHIVDERRFSRGAAFAGNNPGVGPGGSPGPGFGPGPRGGAPFQGPQQAIEQFRSRVGAEKTLVLQFEGNTTREQSESYRTTLMRLTGSKGHSSVSINNRLTLIVEYSGDVPTLANQIPFGKVLSVSATERTIVVAGN